VVDAARDRRTRGGRGTVQPPSAQLLIRKLQVEKAAVDGQSEAITRWLAKNDPGPSLELSLRRLRRVAKKRVALRLVVRPRSNDPPHELLGDMHLQRDHF
jgi:hypothetical protein